MQLGKNKTRISKKIGGITSVHQPSVGNICDSGSAVLQVTTKWWLQRQSIITEK